MVIGAILKKNVYSKPCMRKQDESNNCKYSVFRNRSYNCNVYYVMYVNPITQIIIIIIIVVIMIQIFKWYR
jgi:hypothetical protein